MYREAARWLESLAAVSGSKDHTDTLFVEKILFSPARVYRRRAAGLLERGRRKHGEPLSEAEVLREYRRLAALFDVRLASFERKKFVNLSRRANKAMNLNSYLGLMGRSFRPARQPDGTHLEACDTGGADFSIPNSDYVITLDADSLLLNDYAMRLVHFMEQPQNRRVAVAQTPYSAVPGTPNTMERVAGATTDIQHIIHQGFTGFDATYWVGANALLRRAALEEIAETSRERGFVVTKFIQDRTVIEDTESTVDLVRHGWRLYNYPERLAYSATPRDFGALVIQRRRWANGGLIILPKLLAYLSHGLHRLGTLPEAIMRVHYLTSLAGVSLAMVILLAHPFERGLRNYWLPLTALPYFFLYGRDLVRSGYSWADLPRVYALNLLLIPVNLGGVCRSLYQACTGRETPFVRTPKVAGRTAAPPFYVVAAAGIVMWCVAYMAVDLEKARWAHAIFLLFNAGFMVYAIARLVGLREAWEDVRSLSSATESYQGLSRPAVRSKVV